MSEQHSELPDGIAIIGMAGRFPGAQDVESFWHNLLHGVESRTVFSDEELERAGVPRALRTQPGYVPAGFVLEGEDRFDAGLFQLSPREAEILDPQQRLFLECAWEALERAGYSSEQYPGAIAVFAGTSASTYLLSNLLPREELLRTLGEQALVLANDKDYLATRTSFLLNLKGPSLSVQTACSTSLVAVHLACQSLLNGETDVALAGGVSVSASQRTGYLYQPNSISSPDGHCRAFDERAQGTLSGSGVAVVVLKRLDRAIEDGDTLLAVIRGSALNNDGSGKVGFTAPSVEGQASVIAEALSVAGLAPADIQYVEAHGTATPLGDPIEVSALNQAFKDRPASAGPCALGSVKTNIGHLDAAAGVAGLIKTVLALHHRKLPPSLHFQRPNPSIDFARGLFQVNAEARDWTTDGSPRRAGVSSFGMGGTNAHVVLEEAPTLVPARGVERPWRLLVLSARSAEALEKATDNLAEHLARHPGVALEDVAHTLQAGRWRFEHRRVLVCQDTGDARQVLASRDARRLLTQEVRSAEPSVVFLFPGQGSQHAGMGQGLYESEPVFRKHVDTCCEKLRPLLGVDLRELLHAPAERREEAQRRLQETALAQPALFVTEYALARLWMSLGVKPRAMLGHSLGEYVAACVAGVMSVDDALALVAARGQLMQALPAGAMVSVALPAEQLRPLLGAGLSLAAINAHGLCVASGPLEDVRTLEERLGEGGVEYRRLHTSHAFHSAMMDPILESFAERLGRIRLSPPKIPYVSNLTGRWITPEQATDPRYWVEHLRQPVLFGEGLAALLQDSERVFLEVGPGQTLGMLARQVEPAPARRPVFASMRGPRDEKADLAVWLEAVGRLWMAGVRLEAHKLHGTTRRVPLPTYPFQRQRYWIDAQARAESTEAPPSRGERKPLDEWFYRPVWTRSLPPEAPRAQASARWLLWLDGAGLGQALASRLAGLGDEVVTVSEGASFSRLGERQFAVNPREPEQYAALLSELSAQGGIPQRIVHLGNLSRERQALTSATFEAQQERGFHGALFFVQALLAHAARGPFDLRLVTQGVHDVTGDEPLEPGRATVLGLCKVLPQEEAQALRCHGIDVVLPEAGGAGETRLVGQLVAELRASSPGGAAVAYRGGQRWVESFEPVRLPASGERPALLRERGVYLITGGLGRLGLALAEELSRRVGARLVLVGRTPLPERTGWEEWLRTHDAGDGTSRTLRRLLALEERGSEVLVVGADVSRPEQMEAAVARTLERFGELHGVVHSAGSVNEDTFFLAREATPARCASQFQAKVHGLLALHQALRGRTLDFVVLQSSLSSVLGGLGFSAYAAANAFMDVFAAERSREQGTPWVSVNWDGWHTGEGAPAELTMALADGLEAFHRLLSAPPLARWAVSTADLPARMAFWLEPKAPAAPKAVDARHPRPALPTRYVAPRDAIETGLVACWEELLGIYGIGVEDDFFELGGHSLLGTQVLSRVRDEFQVELPLRSLFDSPTVSALALLILKNKAGSVDQDTLEAMLAELE